MSLKTTFPSNIPDQTQEIGNMIMSEDDVCRYLGNHIEEILSEDDFREFYSSTGRSGVHPFILAMVTVLQYLEKLPDRRACEQAVKRIGWKYALRQLLTWPGFHYSDLCNFRKRLLNHNAETLVFDKLIQHLLDKGWLKSRGKQRTDATHILGQVQRLSQVELQWESLRMALVDLMTTNGKWVLEHLDDEFIQTHTTSRNTYRMSDVELKKLEKQLKNNMLLLLNLIDKEGNDDWLKLTYVQLLHRVAREQLDCVDPSEFPDWQDSALRARFTVGLDTITA